MNSPRHLNEWKQEAGPLKAYLNDPTISEIMVNRWDSIFIERDGIIEQTESKFANAEALNRFVQSLCAFMGWELNRKNPFLDARMPDGSRLNIIVPPVAFESPTITIRKVSTNPFNYQALIKAGTVDDKLIYFLKQAVTAKQNILISGGTGSGKTTVLGVLSSFIGGQERVVSIEDTAEMKINVKNIVRLESGSAGDENISQADLLRNALRMRPDRIIIGECRGAEAFDMLMAMNTGHEGSMSTIHANSATDALRRLEAMIIRAGIKAPHAMVQTDIASTIDFVVQTSRSSDGTRRVIEVLEVLGKNQDGYHTQTVFHFQDGAGILSTGYIPKFVLASKGKFPGQFFEQGYKVKLTA